MTAALTRGRSAPRSNPTPLAAPSLRSRLFVPGWPLVLALGGFPLWAVLGLAQAIWVIAAAFMAVDLIRAKGVRIPRGFGLWVCFIVWSLMSVVMLVPSAGALLAFAYRSSVYIAAGIILLYVYNLPESAVSTERILKLLFVPAGVVVLGGFAGLMLYNVEFGPLIALVPAGLREGFVTDLLQPRFAQVQTFLGFELPRPAYPYRFTNQWGAVLATLVPLSFAGWSRLRGLARVVFPGLVLVASIPIVVSVNRGLWLSVIAVFSYVIARRAYAGQRVRAVQALLGVAVLALVISLTPLSNFVVDRANSDHSNRSRSTLYALVIEEVQESPVLGFGAPRPNPDNPFLPPVGTHGQFWMVLFSHGYPAAMLFVGFLVSMIVRTGRDLDRERLWLHAAVVALLVQMWFYNLLPGSLCLGFLTLGLLLRHRRLAGVNR